MNVRGIVRGAATLALAGALALGATLPASAHGKGGNDLGNRSLVDVLTQDKKGFDNNSNDFDILTAAVTAVLTAKADSPVAVLADGSVPLTAFLPTDGAFRKLAKDALGVSPKTESEVAAALVKALPVDTIENVLLYHVVPGATITYKQALRSNGASLDTALAGSTIKVKVVYCYFVKLVDQDTSDANPYVIKANINKGNKQIAHAINRVLRPIDLP